MNHSDHSVNSVKTLSFLSCRRLSAFIGGSIFLLSSFTFQPSSFAQSITTGPSSNATRTTAAIYGTIASTNGTTNAIIARLFYGTSDATNSFSWASSNVLASYTGAVPCTVSNNLSSLTPSQLYYYRWHVIQGTNSAWASATSNFWTLAGAPTSAAPATPSAPVMQGTNSRQAILWYLNTTNYSYITIDSNKFIIAGYSNGTLYAVTNSIY